MKLCELAQKYGTDKGSTFKGRAGNFYTKTYHEFFEHLTTKKIKLLEIGVLTGASLRMWNDYFPEGEICGIDIFHRDEHQGIKESLLRSGIKVFHADQHYREDLQKTIDHFESGFDIIIDDGSHWNDDIRISLGFLFKHLKPGGIYVVEDCLWGDTKNTQPKTQSGEKLAKHPHRVSHIGTLALEWKLKGTFECPVMLKSEIEYLEENIKSWEIRRGGLLNILHKL